MTPVNFGAKLDKISQNPVIMAVIGAAAGSRLGLWGAFAGGAAGLGAAVVAQGAAESKREIAGVGVGPYGEAAETFYSPGGKVDPLKMTKGKGKEDKGGKSAAAAENSLENFILAIGLPPENRSTGEERGWISLLGIVLGIKERD